jgi:hypothetical protein
METGLISIGDDLLSGAAAIAEFLFGSPNERRRVYHLAERGQIPVFYLGATLHARKSILARTISEKEKDTLARGTEPADPGIRGTERGLAQRPVDFRDRRQRPPKAKRKAKTSTPSNLAGEA